MRKRSKRKPRPIIIDVVNWVVSGLKPISSAGDALIVLKAKNHSAMTEITQGRGNKDQIDFLINALNMAEAYAVHGKGKDWIPEINQAQESLLTMARRGLEKGKFLFTGEELKTVTLAMDVHDLQLEESTVKELERMCDYVHKQIVLGKARRID